MAVIMNFLGKSQASLVCVESLMQSDTAAAAAFGVVVVVVASSVDRER